MTESPKSKVQSPKSNSEGTAGHYWDVLARRVWLLVGIFAGVALIVFAVGAFQQPVYQSTASLLVSENGIGSGKMELFGHRSAGWSMRGPNLANHIEIFKSHTLARMALDTLPRDIREQLASASLDDPVLLRRAVAVRPVRDADVIRLSVQAAAPELARELAKAYVNAYQEFTLSRSRAGVSAVKDFVQSQLNVVGVRLDSAEREMEEYKRAEGVADIAEETKALVERQTGVLALYQQTKAERQGIEQELTYLNSELSTTGLSAQIDSITSLLVLGLRDELSQLEIERTNLVVQGFSETNARVVYLGQRIEAAKQRLKAEVSSFVTEAGAIDGVARVQDIFGRIVELNPELARLRAAEQTFGMVVGRYDGELEMLPARERAMARLTRDVDVNRQVYALLAQRYEEARIQEAGRISGIGVVDVPRNGVKVKPNHRNNILMALMLGLLVSLGTVFAVDRLDTRIRRPEDLERQGFSILANIPKLADSRQLAADGQNMTAEAFRVLRTNIQFAAAGEPITTLQVTSAGAGEGKTTVAANLATVLAQSGKRVLLLDADLRRPRQHVFFGQRKKPGLTDAALLGVRLEQAVRATPVQGLSLLCAGTTPPSPVDFLNSDGFAKLLAQLARDYDCVVVDSPPVLVSADAAVLAARVDGVTFVARMGQTDWRALDEAKKVLAQAGARTIGVVANDLKPRRGYGYYRYRYRYYHYRDHQTPETA